MKQEYRLLRHACDPLHTGRTFLGQVEGLDSFGVSLEQWTTRFLALVIRGKVWKDEVYPARSEGEAWASWFVGDDYGTDVEGARSAGMNALWFYPEPSTKGTIGSLSEIIGNL